MQVTINQLMKTIYAIPLLLMGRGKCTKMVLGRHGKPLFECFVRRPSPVLAEWPLTGELSLIYACDHFVR